MNVLRSPGDDRPRVQEQLIVRPRDGPARVTNLAKFVMKLPRITHIVRI